MRGRNQIVRRRQGERGQTILLVAVAIVSLLAMAALAIDVVTLYVARSELQRAADAVVLLGGLAVEQSGVTSMPPNDPHIIDGTGPALAVSMANAAINNGLAAGTPPINPVAGTQWTVLSQTIQPMLGNNSDWQVTIVLQAANLPTFFARVFGQTAATVTATATAEVYNPANAASFTPVNPRGVKPWLLSNRDPNHSGQLFVNTANGDVEPGVIAQTYTFNPGVAIGFAPGQYLPALVASPPNSADVCPAVSACTESAYAVYQSSIQCYDATPYQCGLNATSWDNTVIPGGAAGPTQLGVECLTQHPEGTPSDFLDASLWPAGPMQIKPQSGPQTSADVSTSSSVVTFPIIDDSLPINANGGPVTVIGFMQAFIQPTSANGSLIVVVLNIAGCSDTPSGAPSPIIGGMGTSPVAVRLITWP